MLRGGGRGRGGRCIQKNSYTCKWEGVWIFSGTTQSYSTDITMCGVLLAEEQMKQKFIKWPNSSVVIAPTALVSCLSLLNQNNGNGLLQEQLYVL